MHHDAHSFDEVLSFYVSHLIESKNFNDDQDLIFKATLLSILAHGWHLAIVDAPLFKEDVLAYKYGPAIFSQNKDAYLGNIHADFPQKSVSVMDTVLERYGHFTGNELNSILTQKNHFWHACWENALKRAREMTVRITPSLMHEVQIIPNHYIQQFFINFLPKNN